MTRKAPFTLPHRIKLNRPKKLKTCRRCHKAKYPSDFSISRKEKDGLQPYCKECAAEYQKRYYEARKSERGAVM